MKFIELKAYDIGSLKDTKSLIWNHAHYNNLLIETTWNDKSKTNMVHHMWVTLKKIKSIASFVNDAKENIYIGASYVSDAKKK